MSAPALPSRSATEQTVYALLKHLSVQTRSIKLSSELSQHPDNPSILAISDVLTNFQIPNSVFQIPLQEMQALPVPFLALIATEEPGLVLIKGVQNGDILTLENGRPKTFKATEFAAIYTGVVLVAENPNKLEGITNSFGTFKELSIAFIVTFTSITILWFTVSFFASTLPPRTIGTLLIKFSGVFACSVILLQRVNSNLQIFDVLCKTSGRSNCSSIINSDAAKINKWLNWSEVGFYYFVSTALLTIFGLANSSLINLTVLLSIACLPFTVYSLYYQFKIAKQTCTLCMVVQMIIWIDFAFMYFHLQNRIDAFAISLESVSLFIFSLAFPVLAWTALKPILNNAQLSQKTGRQIQKFKFNKDVFQALLEKSPKTTPRNPKWCINYYEDQRKHTLTIVTNPLCKPCAKAHSELMRFIEQRDDVNVELVFACGIDPYDKRRQIVTHFLALRDQFSLAQTKKALHDWFAQKTCDYEKWSAGYPIENYSKDYIDDLNSNENWCLNSEVKETPTIFLNGRILPEMYKIVDLKYMLD